MKKRTLTILLIIPFIISLMTFVSIKILDNQVAVDILGIEWDYDENEGFQVDNIGYELKAKPIIDPNLILAKGNDLVWSLKKINETDEDFASIEKKTESSIYLPSSKVKLKWFALTKEEANRNISLRQSLKMEQWSSIQQGKAVGHLFLPLNITDYMILRKERRFFLLLR